MALRSVSYELQQDVSTLDSVRCKKRGLYLGSDIASQTEKDGGLADTETHVDTKAMLDYRGSEYEQKRVYVDGKYDWNIVNTTTSIAVKEHILRAYATVQKVLSAMSSHW